MKVMEAPEKIYLQDSMSTDTIGDLWPEWFDAEVSDNSIEYTRIDAFIEKAVNFLEMLGYGFTITDNITHTIYDEEQLIEDFKNYIKG